MRMPNSFYVLGLGGCLVSLACSSKNAADNANSGPPGYNPNGGASGGQLAQNTVNGTAPITAATATSLTNGSSACAKSTSVPEGGTPPVLEFVIDASGSMSSDPADPADPNGPSKWDVFSSVMPGVFQSLPANFAVGVSYFNKPSGGTCWTPNQAVPIGPMSAAQVTLINRSIQNTNPQNYTPTYAAWKYGLDTLTGWQAPTAYATSPRFIVLITDGVPTVNRNGCTVVNPITQTEYDAQIGLIQTEGQAAGVKTFVVGVVGSENPQGATYDPLYMLSRIAVAGGTAQPAGCVPVSGTPANTTVNPRGTYCHFDLSQAADFGTALAASLGSIAQSVISCNYTIPAPAAGQTIDASTTTLVYNDGAGNYSLVLQNTSTTCDKGWHFSDPPTNSKIEICSTTCSMLQKNAAAQLQLVFGCAVGQIIN